MAVFIWSIPPADARSQRSAQARGEFKRLYPCPATGKERGACPGYTVDHIIPLCAGGVDRPANMQWQTKADAKIKDRWERFECASHRRSSLR